jgi:quercetin dioxygenase-like cupin family protein
MRRIASFLAVFALVLVSLAALASPRWVMAQDGTPAAGPPPEEEGVTFTPLGFAAGVALPSQGDLILVDVALEPGAVSHFLESDPTGGMLYVESGELTVVNQTSPLSVTRGHAMQEAMAAGSMDDSSFMETIEAGQETTLAEGDVAYVPGNIAGEMRNDGDTPAEGTIFLIAPGGTLAASEGTPTP